MVKAAHHAFACGGRAQIQQTNLPPCPLNKNWKRGACATNRYKHARGQWDDLASPGLLPQLGKHPDLPEGPRASPPKRRLCIEPCRHPQPELPDKKQWALGYAVRCLYPTLAGKPRGNPVGGRKTQWRRKSQSEIIAGGCYEKIKGIIYFANPKVYQSYDSLLILQWLRWTHWNKVSPHWQLILLCNA